MATECGKVLDQIVSTVSGVTKMAGEISTASSEQAQGVQEITKAMNQLDQVTQQNAATSEEAASAAEELSAQAGSLDALVRSLTETIHGRSGAGTPAPVAVAAAPKRAPKKAAKSNVVPLPRAEKTAAAKQKKAAGAEGTPDFEDPRFHDV
jgi:methyl-accepting chemotaxis protein